MVWDCNMVDKSDYDKLLALYRALQPQMTNPAEGRILGSQFLQKHGEGCIFGFCLYCESWRLSIRTPLNTTGTWAIRFKANPNPSWETEVPNPSPGSIFIITQAMEINHPFFRMTENKMTISEAVFHFHAKKAGKGKYTAKCPCHVDRSKNTLSLREGKKGVLVKCWAGCPTMADVASQGCRGEDDRSVLPFSGCIL